MTDEEAQVQRLLISKTKEQLARAYLKASRERREAEAKREKAEKDLRQFRNTVQIKEKLGDWARSFGA